MSTSAFTFILSFKTCKKCNIEKDINEFHKDYKSVDGYVGQCKECIKLKTKIYNIKISNIKKEKNDLSYSELMENRVKKCYMCNIDKSFDDFYLSKKLKTGYRNECKECSIKYSVNYLSNYRKNDPLKLLSDKIRSNILQSFKKAGFRKSNRTHEILGCSFEYFRTYIMSKFEPWMSFENHGKYNGTYNYGWDLDHIIPISSAITEYDIIKLNHYSNFQPLCSKINRFEKKDKLEYIIKK